LRLPSDLATRTAFGYFNPNLAREAGRLADWREKLWSRRYRAIVVSGEEGAQRERLKYVLSHGAKEGLVVCSAGTLVRAPFAGGAPHLPAEPTL